MLGLGLGLNKGGYIKPLPKWLTDAGCTFAINVDRQVKALANPNSPFINPLEDVGYAKKFNITQSVLNGDFTGGTTRWTVVGGTISASNKIGSVVGDGTLVESRFVYNNAITTPSTDKKFIKARVRVTNSNCTNIIVRLGGGTQIQQAVNNPVINQWYDFYFVGTGNTDNAIRIYQVYPDAATANGKVMEVDGNVGVFAIPMTGTPLENYTADKINALITEYFEGTKQISAKLTALLQSFAGTTADGYTQIALPNGKNPWFVNSDGTDSYMIGVNNSDTDILGTVNFGLGFYTRTNGTLVNSWLISKAESSEATTQYGVKITSAGALQLFLNGALITLATGLAINTPYKIVIVREAGTLKCEVNDVETYSAAEATSLTTQPNLRLGARSSNIGGTTHTEFYNGLFGAFVLSQGSLCTLASFKKSFAKLIGGTYV